MLLLFLTTSAWPCLHHSRNLGTTFYHTTYSSEDGESVLLISSLESFLFSIEVTVACCNDLLEVTTSVPLMGSLRGLRLSSDFLLLRIDLGVAPETKLVVEDVISLILVKYRVIHTGKASNA